MSQLLSALNNPVVFLALVTLGVTAMQYLLALLFHKLGWHGVEHVFNGAAHQTGGIA